MKLARPILDFGFWILECVVNPKSKIHNPQFDACHIPRMLLIYSAWLMSLAACSVASACPMCKEALFDPGQLHQRLATAKGYALSIGLMLSVPVILVTTVATVIVRAQRRHHR